MCIPSCARRGVRIRVRWHLAVGLLFTQLAVPALPQIHARDLVPVTIVAEVPETTPTNDVVYIAGNLPALGPWDPGRQVMRSLGSRRYSATVLVPAGTTLEYKITRGSWETVEKNAQGEEISNRRWFASQADTIELHVATWRDQVEDVPTRPATFTGRIQPLGKFESTILGNARDVWVYLPPSYASAAETRYPVLYFHDGQNVFNAATAFIGIEWRADETLEELCRAGEIREAIAVAVANSPHRVDEYTPIRDRERGEGGGADDYLRFLVEELKPRIDQRFRTLREREHTAIIGSSLGGLVSLYAGLAASQTFGLVAGVSPSLWWGNEDLSKRYAAVAPERLPLRVWIDMGTAEGEPGPAKAEPSSAIRGLRRFRDVLLKRDYEPGSSLGYREDPGALHNEAAWAKRLPDILRFLLPNEDPH